MLSQHSKLKRRAKTAASMAVPEISKPLLMWGKSQELVLKWVKQAGWITGNMSSCLLAGVALHFESLPSNRKAGEPPWNCDNHTRATVVAPPSDRVCANDTFDRNWHILCGIFLMPKSAEAPGKQYEKHHWHSGLITST